MIHNHSKMILFSFFVLNFELLSTYLSQKADYIGFGYVCVCVHIYNIYFICMIFFLHKYS